MPFTQTEWGQKFFEVGHTPSAVKAVKGVCNVVGAFSIQCHDDQVQQTIDWYIAAGGGSDMGSNSSIGPAPTPIKRPDDSDFPPWRK
jgi:hypothetical protein